VKVALVSYPGEIPASRVQLSNLQWEVDSDKKILVGTAAIELPDAERALVLLSVSSTCVQRQWFINSTKTQNGRLLVSKAFDAELKQLSRCLLEPVSQDKFELAVSHLAFLRGFNAQVLVEKEAPDIVLETPGGQLVLVECTIQTKDVHTKVGKLVDRRHALIMALDRAKQRRTVLAALVSQQRREQIAMTDNEFKDRGVVLVTHDMLSEQLGLAGLSVDADEIVRKAVAYLEQD
jgi:hypothetical protein